MVLLSWRVKAKQLKSIFFTQNLKVSHMPCFFVLLNEFKEKLILFQTFYRTLRPFEIAITILTHSCSRNASVVAADISRGK